MIVVVFLVLAIIAAWLVHGWLKRVHPRHAARFSRWLWLAGLMGGGIWLVATGKLAGLLAIFVGLWTWVGRGLTLHGIWQNLRGLSGGTAQGRSQRPPPPPSSAGTMSEEEARDILGIGPDADAAAIKAAHRRLMEANHPDRGGSTWIAARLNLARDRLLG